MRELKYPRNEKGDYICPHCPEYTTTHKNTIFYHMKLHEGEFAHQCKYCDCKFNYYKPLQYHIQSKHPDKIPTNSCPCPDCKYKGKEKRDVRIHFIRKHCKHQLSQIRKITDNGFQCAACNCDFKSADLFCYHAIDCLNKTEIPLLTQL